MDLLNVFISRQLFSSSNSSANSSASSLGCSTNNSLPDENFFNEAESFGLCSNCHELHSRCKCDFLDEFSTLSLALDDLFPMIPKCEICNKLQQRCRCDFLNEFRSLSLALDDLFPMIPKCEICNKLQQRCRCDFLDEFSSYL